MASLRVYWDACAWIGLIQEEPDRIQDCKAIIQKAKLGDIEIWTSTFTLAEVYKKKCSGEKQSLYEENDDEFEEFLLQEFVILAQVDTDIGVLARQLLRKHSILRKPQDAVHLATAAFHNVDELHTFDGSDLLPLDGQVKCTDGSKLKICVPSIASLNFPGAAQSSDLLELIENLAMPENYSDEDSDTHS